MRSLYFAGRDNVYGFICIDQQGTPVDLSIVDYAEIAAGGLVLDSNSNQNIIALAHESVLWRGTTQELWLIKLWLGRSELEPGRYSARITLYAGRWPNGLVVKDGLAVEIVA